MKNANFTSEEQEDNPGQCLGGQQCGAAQTDSACSDLGSPCSWEAPNMNNMQRGMKFFANMTYSLGYGRHSVSTEKWTYNGWDAADVKKIPSSFMTTSYALDFKVPLLQWMECLDFETCKVMPPAGNKRHGHSTC